MSSVAVSAARRRVASSVSARRFGLRAKISDGAPEVLSYLQPFATRADDGLETAKRQRRVPELRQPLVLSSVKYPYPVDVQSNPGSDELANDIVSGSRGREVDHSEFAGNDVVIAWVR